MNKGIFILLMIILSGIAVAVDFDFVDQAIVPQFTDVNIIRTCKINNVPCANPSTCNISFYKQNTSVISGEMSFGVIDPTIYAITNFTFNVTETDNEEIPFIISCCHGSLCNINNYLLTVQNSSLNWVSCPKTTNAWLLLGFYTLIIFLFVGFAWYFQVPIIDALASYAGVFLVTTYAKCNLVISGYITGTAIAFAILCSLISLWNFGKLIMGKSKLLHR